MPLDSCARAGVWKLIWTELGLIKSRVLTSPWKSFVAVYRMTFLTRGDIEKNTKELKFRNLFENKF